MDEDDIYKFTEDLSFENEELGFITEKYQDQEKANLNEEKTSELINLIADYLNLVRENQDYVSLKPIYKWAKANILLNDINKREI